MNCEIGGHIKPEGWHNWGNKQNEQTARYEEYNNKLAEGSVENRVGWSRQLSKKEASKITIEEVFKMHNYWIPE